MVGARGWEVSERGHLLTTEQKDGLEAVEKINNPENNESFDLIFMDIIMPNLDGVSATAMIRMVTARVPIIAMTSNIRQEDIQTYFQYGKLRRTGTTLSASSIPNIPFLKV